MFFICSLILLLPPCESQSPGRLRHWANFVRVGSEIRCDWDCVVVDSEFGKAMKKLISEYRLVTLDLTFEQRVDQKCLNQTNLYNSTKPADIWTWLSDDSDIRGKNMTKQSIGENSSVTWFRKSFEGQKEVTVVCDLRLTKDSAVNDTRPSLNDRIALVLMEEAANATELFYSGPILCYKESTKNGSYVCLDITSKADNISVRWSLRTLQVLPIPIAFALMLYSPILLWLFSPTEVHTENGQCVILLSGISPVGIRSRLSNFFFRRNMYTKWWKMGLTTLFIVVYSAVGVALIHMLSWVLNLHLKSVFNYVHFYFEFTIFCYVVSLLFTLRDVLSLWLNKLATEDGGCLICKWFGDDKTIVHQGFLEELKQHLSIQPSIVVRCFEVCLNLWETCFQFVRKSVDSIYLALFLFPITLVVVVPLLFILFLLMTTACIFFSCPLSSFNTSLVFPYIYKDDSGSRMRGMFRKIFYTAFTFMQFSPLVMSFGMMVFLMTVVSLTVIRGILMHLPDYLPYATLVVIVAFYSWRCYSSFTRKYYNLLLKLYKHHKASAQGTEDEQVISFREDDAKVIPKDLFEKVCKKLIPLRESVGILVVKLLSLLTFTFVVFAVIMETPEASDRAKATATFCTVLVPKIIEMLFSKDAAMEELDDEIFDKKVKYIVDEYINSADNSCNNNDSVVENERAMLVNNDQIDVQHFGTFMRSRNGR